MQERDIFWELDENRDLLGRPELLVVGDPFWDRMFIELIFLRDPRKDHLARDKEIVFETCQAPARGLGGAFSIAMAWRAFGKVTVCGAVGDDDEGRALAREARRQQIGDGLVAEQERSTIVKWRLTPADDPLVPFGRLRVDEECDKRRQEVCPETEEAILLKIRENFHRCDAVAMMDFEKGSVTDRIVREVARLCAGSAKPLLIRPKHDWYKYTRIPATVVSAQSGDAIRAAEARTGYRDPGVARNLIDELGKACPLPSYAVVKLGEHGAAFASATETMRVTATEAKPFVHTIHAGDVFDAYQLVALWLGFDIRQALRLANLAAGIACTMQVTEWPTLKEVLRGITGSDCYRLTSTSRKILSLFYQGITTTKEIAERRGISDETVKTQVQLLMNTLGAHQRATLLPRAEREGLITPAMKIGVEKLDESLKVA